MQDGAEATAYHFAGCVLDTRIRELTVGGAAVHVEPQVFDVLRYLIEKRDCVVSRDDLVEAVWAGRIVSEATIGARIWAARQAVGDTGEAQAVIRTLPRRGFRFVAPVTAVLGSDDGASAWQGLGAGIASDDGSCRGPADVARRVAGPDLAPQPAAAVTVRQPRLRRATVMAGIVALLLGAGAVGSGQLGQARLEPASVERMAFPLPDKPSIAVLPFANLTSSAASDLMSRGLTESLIGALARNPSLFVIAATSTAEYKGRPAEPKQVAEAFGVRYIVDGSVKRHGDRVRVTAQLVDTLGGRVLWSQRYQRSADDLLDLEETITTRIARSLDVRIIYGTEAPSGGTRRLDAWAAFVRGRTDYLKFTRAGNARARQHYLHALAVDPDYAEAVVALAHTHVMEIAHGSSQGRAGALARVVELERQAASIAPHMPLLFELRSLLALTRGDYDLALAHAEAMAEADPNGAESHYTLGRMYFFTGRYQRAIAALGVAERINPHSRASYYSHLAFSHLALGSMDVAIAILEAIPHRWPGYAPGRAYLAIGYQLAGREAEARQQVALLPRLAPDVTMLSIQRRFTPLQDREYADRLLEAARQAGIPHRVPSTGSP